MGFLIFLLIIAALFIYLIWYLFFRSVLWVAEPLIEYMENREAERFIIEDIGKNGFEDSDIEKIPKKKLKINIKTFGGFIQIPKTILQKAQKEPQKLPNTELWVYKDCIFSSKPTKEKLDEIFEEIKKRENNYI